MSYRSRSWVSHYGCAFASVALAIGLRRLLVPVLGSQFPFSTIFLAILVTAWYGGFRPALASLILGALGLRIFLMPPSRGFVLNRIDGQVGLALYIFTGLGISLLAGSMHSARRRAEAAASLGRYQAELIERTYDPILVWEWYGPVTFWNRGAERLYGFTRREAVGRVSHELLNTSTQEGLAGLLGDLEREGFWEGELHHIRRDGRPIVVESRMALIRTGERAYVIEANRDITERRKAQTALREAIDLLEMRVAERTDSLERSNASLQASEAHIRRILQGVTSHAILMLNMAGNVVSWDPGAELIKGYRPDEIIGRHFSRFYTPEDVESGKPERHLQQAIAAGGAEDEGWRVRKDGSRFWAIVNIIPVYGDAAEPVGLVNITRDITEQRKIQEALGTSEKTEVASG